VVALRYYLGRRPPSTSPRRQNRAVMRKLAAEIFDPKTRYEYESPRLKLLP
jgi:hypothetical protein